MISCPGTQHLEERDAHLGASAQVLAEPIQLTIRFLIVTVWPHCQDMGPQS